MAVWHGRGQYVGHWGQQNWFDSALPLTSHVILDKSLYQSGKQKPFLLFQQRVFNYIGNGRAKVTNSMGELGDPQQEAAALLEPREGVHLIRVQKPGLSPGAGTMEGGMPGGS